MNRNVTLLTGLTLLLMGCPKTEERLQPPEDAGRSPNATLRPSPPSPLSPSLGSKDAGIDGRVGIPADSKGRLSTRDAGVPDPTPMVPAKALPRDVLPHRDLQGVTLAAEWHWDAVPSAPSGGEVNGPGIKAAREATRHVWQVEILDSGRMRVVFDSPSFPLTKFTEIRSRTDRFGHVMVWPDTEAYRVIPPGALRALLDERRVDVSPLVAENSSGDKSVKPRFGFPTLQVSAKTPWGEVVLEQARTLNVGTGGPLLCRLLLELVGVRPDSTLCEENNVPVHASFEWKDGGKINFEVSSLLIRTDFPGSLFAVPPPRARFTDDGLPPNASGVFLTREQMTAFRLRATEPPSPRTDLEAKGAPGEGFLAVNSTDALRYLLVDGIPVTWVPALGQQYVIGSRNGHYNIQWRSFLGTTVDEPKEVWFPARMALGEPVDAGAPPGASSAPAK